MRGGLHFQNSPFANATEETRRLAAIEGAQERTRETLAFLNTLPPPPAPLPWEGTGNTPAPPPDPAIKAAETQIDALLKNALLTRITADQFADQIETALRGVPATHGNELAPPLQTMAEFAAVLRHLGDRAPTDDENIERAAMKLRISHLEALVERLKTQLSDEKQAREAADALAAKDGFWKSYRKSAGTAAGVATVGVFTIGVPSAAVYFLGAEHPLVRAALTVVGRLPD